MKILNAILAIMFIGFASLQFNDPDPVHWVLVYAVVALLCALAVFDRYPRWAIIGSAVIIGVWMFWTSPDVFAWIKMGMPTITGSMEPDEPYVELVRESLGLLIALLAVLHLLRLSRKKA